MIIPILSVIVVVAVIGYATFFYLQHKYLQEISKQQAQISSFIESSLNDELANMKEIHLSGQTRQQFEETRQSYLYSINHRLPEISERLLELQDACKQYHFMQVYRELKLIAAKMQAAAKLENKTRSEITRLKRSNQLHRQKLHELEQRYQALRKKLLAKNFSYGPSIDKLEESLGNLENTFDQYANFAQKGDYIQADQILNHLEKNTAILDEQLKQIPKLYRSQKNVYPDQLAEILSGFQQLMAKKYGFKEDLAAEVKKIQAQIGENLVDLKNLQVSVAAKRDQEIVEKIDQLYDQLEQELKARHQVENTRRQLGQFVRHARQQQHELMIELDRLSQNYSFNHHEMEDGRELGVNLKKIENEFSATSNQIREGVPIYSEVLLQQQTQVDSLQQIEERQTKINQSIQGLWHEEQEARQAVQAFDLEIHQLHRKLVKQNLPGLPKSYLDFFLAVSDEIDRLLNDLDQVKIDLDQISKNLLDIQADLDKLTEKTNDISDSAALAEVLLQYANRYKNRYPEVAQAANQADQLFKQKFDYAASLEKIATAVDQVEPGAYKKLENQYYVQNPTKESLN
ncbi:septation ring formation regulator EzrA [Liquorilactobacillus sicerae]|uniref:septation ring formation regulator EzrA n=1 Tax=Liquorilactobacillus sicerae TaxID=1416943 RepID=UPI0024815B8E|nr:septation ring formation regulator EzrA [Liquorilactobacillus sicerae]